MSDTLTREWGREVNTEKGDRRVKQQDVSKAMRHHTINYVPKNYNTHSLCINIHLLFKLNILTSIDSYSFKKISSEGTMQCSKVGKHPTLLPNCDIYEPQWQACYKPKGAVVAFLLWWYQQLSNCTFMTHSRRVESCLVLKAYSFRS